MKQIRPALLWIAQYWAAPELNLKRVFGASKKQAAFDMILDASPWGLGGYLASLLTGTPLQYFESKLTCEDEKRFGRKIGESAGQQIWEALSVPDLGASAAVSKRCVFEQPYGGLALKTRTRGRDGSK